MAIIASFLITLVLGVLSTRQWLLNRVSEVRPGEPFDGVIYRVGEAAIAERSSLNPTATVICMHGFIENLSYFTHFYHEPRIQLILLNSCGYHVPVDQPRYREVDWARTPSAAEGTIEYDAEVLNQALEHLPKSDRVRVHGHSRGGAVVLEAASQRPDLFENVEVILEAPVLPQAKPYREMPAAQLWFLSFLVPLWRRQPINRRNRAAWGPLDDEQKRKLIEGLPFNPKRVSTMVNNMRSMGEWMESRPTSLYRHIRKGYVLVPEKDRVLDPVAMYESARQGQASGLEIVQIKGCSHFPLFDQPDTVPPLHHSAEKVELAGA